jgi:hypothetical protein
MGAPLHCFACEGGSEYLESWGMGGSKQHCGFITHARSCTSLLLLYIITVHCTLLHYAHTLLYIIEADVVQKYNTVSVITYLSSLLRTAHGNSIVTDDGQQ